MKKFVRILSVLLMTSSLSFGRVLPERLGKHYYSKHDKESLILSHMPKNLQNKIEFIEDSYDLKIKAVEVKYQNEFDKFKSQRDLFKKQMKSFNKDTLTAEQAKMILEYDVVREQYRVVKHSMKQEVRKIREDGENSIRQIKIDFLKSIK